MVRIKKKVRDFKNKGKASVLKKKTTQAEYGEEFQYTGQKSNLVIWLDVDATLLDAHTSSRYSWDDMQVFCRPYLRPFVYFCKRIAKEVNVFSAGPKIAVAMKLDASRITAKRVLTQDDVVGWNTNGRQYGYYYPQNCDTALIKRIPDFDVRTTLVIDDKPAFYLNNVYPNVLKIAEFKRDHEYDKAFLLLVPHLRKLAENPDRDIEKWIEGVQTAHSDYFYRKTTRYWDFSMKTSKKHIKEQAGNEDSP